MVLLKDLFNTDRIKLVGENEKIRRNKKRIEKEFEQYKETTNQEINDLKNKYIELLEEKAKGFDSYKYYLEESIKHAEKVRELKKELADAKDKRNRKEV